MAAFINIHRAGVVVLAAAVYCIAPVGDVTPLGCSLVSQASGQSTYGPPYASTGLPAVGLPAGTVPRAPLVPQNAARPDGWPGGTATGFSAGRPAPRGPVSMPLEGAKILARIDSDVILYSEVAAFVNQTIAANADRFQGQITPEQEKMIRDIVMQRAVAEMIPNKLLVADARRTIPAESLPKVMEQFADTFEKSELPKMIERSGAKDRQDLDAKLREFGTSLSREKQAYVEKTLAQQWLRQQLDFDREIPYQEIVAYYEEHVADYEQPAEVRWQQLMKQPDRYHRQETETEMRRLGNELWRGALFDQVAKAHSDGPSAVQGGWFDWTKLGGDELGEFHLSAEIKKALAELPENRLSRIIEDDQGFHIIRVLERKPATRAPLADVQQEIRDKLRSQRINQQVQQYIAQLKERATIWTVFDDAPAEQQLTTRPGAPASF